MLQDKTFLALIPARGGSKRLPGKNLLDFAGKPLIAWSIEAGLQSKYITELVVSSDNEQIINIAQQYGAEVPFKRPAHLSDDTASSADVIKHAMTFYSDHLNKKFDYVVLLQPTSPLRDVAMLDGAIEFLFAKNADAVISVCELEHPLQWCGVLPENKAMGDFLEAMDLSSRSQDLPTHYRLNGAIYICATDKFIAAGSMFLKRNIFAYQMPQHVSVDIDTEQDFQFAQALLSVM